MSNSLSELDEPVDLNNCDREPIHIPGAIQPHGVLFACRPSDLVVEQVSRNVLDHFGRPTSDFVERPLTQHFDDESAKLLLETSALAHPRENSPLRVRAKNERPFDAILHRSGDVLVVELEPSALEPHVYHPQLRHSIARLHNTTDLLALCQVAVDEVRQLTGFDRVMAYRFDAEWNGQVIAESKIERLSSFLGQHYPASDIPAQARRLYTVNWLRFIADANYQPAALEPALNARTHAPLDMSQSVLRSVSPIHCEYLRNMGVDASMSVSLVRDGQLWGLIACHHYSGPKLVPYVIRDSCEFLAQALSWHVSSKERAEVAEKAARTAELERKLFESMVDSSHFVDGLAQDTLLSLASASGAAIVYDGNVRLVGDTPSEADVRTLGSWVESRLDDGFFVTDRLASLRPTTSELDDRASGLMVVAISEAHGDYVMWFRASTERVVDWAGHPYKNVTVEDGVSRLSPRGSFELWRETVRGRSLPWQPWEITGATNVRRAILGGVRRREADVQAFNARLVELDRTKDLFIATVSHELRTPLNAITGWVELLRQGIPDESRRAHGLSVIHRNAQAQAQLVDDLLDMSRVASGKFSLSVERLDMAQVVEFAIESVSLAAEAKGIRVMRLIDTTGTTMLGDARRLQQVVWNLLNNAIKFTPKSGKIEVVLQRQGSDIELTVKDTGEGITADFLPHLFDAFRQAGSRGSTSYRKGLGLGMSITRHIVEAHGGKIVAESEGAGQGATFRVRVPVSPLLVPREATVTSAEDGFRNELEGVVIVVVEDDPDSRDLLGDLLSEAGARWESFGSAEQALVHLAQNVPDLILSDIGLPGMDGYEFISRVRSLSPELGGAVPAVALTAHTRSKDRTQALRSGFSSHVPKPVDPSELLAVLRSLLGRRPTPV